jgi:CHAT domain-containing protein
VFCDLNNPTWLKSSRVHDVVDRVASLLEPTHRRARLTGELRDALRAAGRALLSPVLASLPADFELRALLVSPDWLLGRVPFDALLTDDVPAGTDEREWPFLIRRCAVSYVQGGTMLRDLCARRNAREAASPRGDPRLDFVAFANPAYTQARPTPGETRLLPLADADRWGALVSIPGTAQEVLRIASLVANPGEQRALDALARRAEDTAAADTPPIVEGNRFTLFLGRAATEAMLERRDDVRRARVLHLACHGAADQRTPALSHVALAAGEGEDGYVVVDELGSVPLDADLLTLSACETSAGRDRRFDGTASLARAALGAGVDAVIATMGPVRDGASSDLMVAFYRDWLRGGVSRAEALAEAKREAIARGVAIDDWAAFVLWDAAPIDAR